MAAILRQILGNRLFSGELMNQIIDQVNNLTGNGTPGAITGSSLTLSSTAAFTQAPQIVSAAGASQGTATAITSGLAFVTVATTNSNKGVRLPTAATGKQVLVACNASHGCKVYPATGGKIGSASTNAADATILLPNKANRYIAQNTTYWAVQRGA